MESFTKETRVELGRQGSGVVRKRRSSRQRTQVCAWETPRIFSRNGPGHAWLDQGSEIGQ